MVSKNSIFKKFDLFFSFYFQIKWLSRPSKHFQLISLQTQLSLLKSIWMKNGLHKRAAKKRKISICRTTFPKGKAFMDWAEFSKGNAVEKGGKVYRLWMVTFAHRSTYYFFYGSCSHTETVVIIEIQYTRVTPDRQNWNRGGRRR